MNMNPRRFLLPVVLTLLCAMALAQSEAQKPTAAKLPPSEAQKSFDQLKTLSGSWEGPVQTDMKMEPAEAMDNKPMQVSIRTTSRGNALVHEMTSPGSKDDPITMFYLDQDRLLLTHYCDAGNRPRMTGKMSPDGKTLVFDFLDIAGNLKYGHMQHAVFTLLDANHHTEEWTFMAGDKPIHARFDLQRTK
jgi:hypothetical protein